MRPEEVERIIVDANQRFETCKKQVTDHAEQCMNTQRTEAELRLGAATRRNDELQHGVDQGVRDRFALEQKVTLNQNLIGDLGRERDAALSEQARMQSE